MASINPLDFERIFISILSGSKEIFIGLSILFISGLGAYFNIPSQIMLIMYVIFAIVFVEYIGGIYVLIILFVGIIVFYLLSRMFNR